VDGEPQGTDEAWGLRKLKTIFRGEGLQVAEGSNQYSILDL
jgi:hypothetical protein